MKRYAIIGILIIVIGAFVLVPFFKGSASEDAFSTATFDFKKDFAVEYNSLIPVSISVPKDIEKVELIYNDSVFQTWNKPSDKIVFQLPASYYGVGTRNLVLRSYFNDGTALDDNRLVRVLSDIAPTPMRVKIIQELSHNAENYTQGLEFNNGQLFEGTGDPNQQGKTKIGQVALSTGLFNEKVNGLDATYFGEGITILGDNLYQLTWKNGTCFVYDKNSLQLQKTTFTYSGEGWGLCNDGKLLIMSDGSERITFRDPKTFNVVKTIEVYDNVGPRTQLNELEYIDGKIYANIYGTNVVVIIEPGTGRVLADIDATELEVRGRNGGDVLNGIAFNPATKKLYFTGKYWTKLFEVLTVEVK